MKSTVAVTVACLASASAFAPSTDGRVCTSLAAAKEGKKSLFKTISEMDLFAPNKDVNDYGARNTKSVSHCQCKSAEEL